jgi:trigger factor
MAAADSDSLRVEVTPEGPVLQRIEVEVDPGRVELAFERAYRELAKHARVRGFRPGKVPRRVLERMYAGSLAEQIEHSLVAETLEEAIQEAGLEAAAEPAVESSAPKPGESFRYTARVEVKPEIELPDLAGLPAQRPRVDVSGEDVERELEALRQRSAPLLEEPEGTALAEGHIATLDFVGRIGGQPFEGGSGQGVDVELGSGQFIPGFEEQLVGSGAGDDLEVTVRFPEDYGRDELAGQQAVFAVHVATVKRREVPSLDDEFAKDLGEFSTLEELRQRIRGDLEASRDRAARSVLQRTLLDSLLERTSFEVPPGVIEQRLQQELYSARQRLEGQLEDDALAEQLARWKEEWRERAERQVRESLLLEAVARSEELTVTPEDVEARIRGMAEQQGVDPARLRKAWGGDAFERGLARQLADEKALEFLAGRAKVEETTDT